jgi:hypothetical protein
VRKSRRGYRVFDQDADRGKIAAQPYGELLADAKFYQTGCQTVSLAQRQHGIILEKLAAQGDIPGAAAQYFERGLKENFQQVDIQVASSALRQAAAAGESQANYDLYLHGERLGLDAVTRQAHHDFWSGWSRAGSSLNCNTSPPCKVSR